eukprot:9409954-Alexandrium_andersonii.AAC.1
MSAPRTARQQDGVSCGCKVQRGAAQCCAARHALDAVAEAVAATHANHAAATGPSGNCNKAAVSRRWRNAAAH